MELCVLIYPEQNPESFAIADFCLVLFTHILVHQCRAAFALDVAAPVELAVAALMFVGLELVVSSAAAHQLTTVHAL